MRTICTFLIRARNVKQNAISRVNIPDNIEVIAELNEIPLMLLDGEQIQKVFQNIILDVLKLLVKT